jgi:hypothetical protein
MQQSLLTAKQYKDLTRKIFNSIETKFRIIPLNTLKHPKYHWTSAEKMVAVSEGDYRMQVSKADLKKVFD